MNSLYSISPIDGRYTKSTAPLAQFFSEAALMRYRIIVEGEYLIALSEWFHSPPFKGGARGGYFRKLSDKEKKLIRSLYDLSPTDAQIISDIETKGYKHIKPTDHDVKAVEYYMKEKLGKTSLKDVLEYLHFALTSYDTNTPARGMMLSDALAEIIMPSLNYVQKALENLAKKYARLPMLARTHGQPASPTTFGKEMAVFAVRLQKQLTILKNIKVSVKFSGATGNFNAHFAAFPKVDWIKFAKKFVDGLNKDRLIKLELN